MSEPLVVKEEANGEAEPKQPRILRLTAILPAAASLAALLLVILLVVSGTKPGTFQDYDLLSLNTSKLGENIIEFTPATTTSSSTATKTKRANPLDPLGLLPTSTAAPSWDSIGSFFQGILENATAAVDGSLSDAEAQLVKAVLSEIGIKEYYSLHILDICSGDVNTNNKVNVTECVSYSDKSNVLTNLTSSIPSSLTLLTTNISVPLLTDLSSLSVYISKETNTFSKTIFAFYIISIVSAFLTLVFSTLSITFTSKMLVYLALGFSLLGLTFQLMASVAVTIMISLIKGIVNSIGNSVGLEVVTGKWFLVLTWVSVGLLLVAQWYWGIVWWVELRTVAWKARKRTWDEVGNWRGIIGEMKRDLKTD